jgi:putative flippase GtrA
LKILKNNEFQSQIKRYTLISIFGYLYIFLSLYLLISLMKVNKSVAFLISYGIWYSILYLIQLKLLFKTNHKKDKLIKFCINLIIFYFVANVLYNVGIYLNLDYEVSTAITILILMPLRFIASKYYVYN